MIKKALKSAFGLRRVGAWRAALSKQIFAGETLNAVGEQKKLLHVSCRGCDAMDYVVGMIFQLPTFAYS